MSFGIATNTGSANSDGMKHSFDQGNVSYHTSNYQIAIFFSLARTWFNCSFNHFVHSQDVQGCSLTIHYAKDAIIENVNIFNITTGTTHVLFFFGYNSLIFNGTHPKGFSEYRTKEARFISLSTVQSISHFLILVLGQKQDHHSTYQQLLCQVLGISIMIVIYLLTGLQS